MNRVSPYRKKWSERSPSEIEEILKLDNGALSNFGRLNFTYDSHFVITTFALFESMVKVTLSNLVHGPIECVEILIPEKTNIPGQLIDSLIKYAKRMAIQDESFANLGVNIESYYKEASFLRNRYAHGFRNFDKSIDELLTQPEQDGKQILIASDVLYERLINALKALVHLGLFDKEEETRLNELEIADSQANDEAVEYFYSSMSGK